MASRLSPPETEKRWYTLVQFLDLVKNYQYNRYCSYIPRSGKHAGYFCGLDARYAFLQGGRRFYWCSKCRHRSFPSKTSKVINTHLPQPVKRTAIPLNTLSPWLR